MNRQEQLKFCKICKNQRFDGNQGIICGLTNAPADFELSCSQFIEDTSLKLPMESVYAEPKPDYRTASQGKRFANYLVDMVALLVFNYLFGIILGILFYLLAPSYLSIFKANHWYINYLFGLIAGIIYFTLLEVTTGRTVGKLFTKTKVVDQHFEKPAFGTVLIRTLCRFIPFEPFSFLVSEDTGWHDKLSKTYVVEIQEY